MSKDKGIKNYKEWLSQVNKNVEGIIGLRISDLNEFINYDFFKIGLSPKKSVIELIKKYNAKQVSDLQKWNEKQGLSDEKIEMFSKIILKMYL